MSDTSITSIEYHHFLLFDNSVQWFTAICRVKANECDMTGYERSVVGNGATLIDIPAAVGGGFLTNLSARPIAFSNRHYGDNTWAGWAISEAEFWRVKRLVELHPLVEEFSKLSSYP